jgi:RNA 3'-phosphate cyclase
MELEIDGSIGEGGGQIIRTSAALSAITGKKMHVYNIRAGRKNPGLQPQHLSSVCAISNICNGKLFGAAVGSQEFTLEPGKIAGGSYAWNIGTAGSVTLLLQAILPAALYSKKYFEFNVIGGTNVPWSPPIENFKHVFLDIMKMMGFDIDLKIEKYGFYPKGGGIVKMSIKPSDPIKLNLLERGNFEKIDLHSIASSDLKIAQVAQRQVMEFVKTCDMKIGEKNIEYVSALSTGSSLHAHAHYQKCKIGAEVLGARGLPAENVGKDCCFALKKEMASNSAVDSHIADQILLYIALFGGSVRIKEMTSHARTNIDIIEKFLPGRLNISKNIISA